VVDDGEECDDGNQEDGDGCSARCEEEICGNGELEGGEVCDGELDAGLTCEDYGYDGGELGCRSDCGPDLTGCYTCGDGTCEAAESPSSCPADCPTLQAVDVLFVVDNSGSMVEEQAQLQADISTFIAELRDPVHGLPDLHVGVTSTDLGTGMFQITYCEDVGGDQGNLLTGSCANPTGAPYLLDVAPQGCNITRDAGGSCTADDCAQQHCPEGTLTADATTGCPRCRNYSGVDLQEAFNCIAALGTLGCGFEQPLEAMHEALDQNTANAGFLRNESILAVMFLTDEDDCSASNPQIFDNSQTDIDSTLGPLTSYRCFEFGVTCDVNDRTHEGERHNCTPRSDADALLHPIDRYTSLLGDLRDPGRVVVSAIAGPVQGGGTVTIGRDEYSQPELQYSCTSEQGGGGAVPGVRLRALVEAVMPPAEMADAYGSICDGTYAIDLGAFAGAIRARMQ
jgi:cysteine-rich repeat protein